VWIDRENLVAIIHQRNGSFVGGSPLYEKDPPGKIKPLNFKI